MNAKELAQEIYQDRLALREKETELARLSEDENYESFTEWLTAIKWTLDFSDNTDGYFTISTHIPVLYPYYMIEDWFNRMFFSLINVTSLEDYISVDGLNLGELHKIFDVFKVEISYDIQRLVNTINKFEDQERDNK